MNPINGKLVFGATLVAVVTVSAVIFPIPMRCHVLKPPTGPIAYTGDMYHLVGMVDAVPGLAECVSPVHSAFWKQKEWPIKYIYFAPKQKQEIYLPPWNTPFLVVVL